MGWIRHHAIVVTGTYDKWIDRAHARAVKIFGEQRVSDILSPAVNGTRSFFVGPDGSKEGWPESDSGDSQRAAFIEWLNTQRYHDNSSPLSWVEILYGDDGGECAVIHHDQEHHAAQDAGD